jgi:hypothetical protein
MSKKGQCPICSEKMADECTFAVGKVIKEGETVVVYCCESQAKTVKNESC